MTRLTARRPIQMRPIHFFQLNSFLISTGEDFGIVFWFLCHQLINDTFQVMIKFKIL